MVEHLDRHRERCGTPMVACAVECGRVAVLVCLRCGLPLLVKVPGGGA
jgi:hypothetical protein